MKTKNMHFGDELAQVLREKGYVYRNGGLNLTAAGHALGVGNSRVSALLETESVRAATAKRYAAALGVNPRRFTCYTAEMLKQAVTAGDKKTVKSLLNYLAVLSQTQSYPVKPSTKINATLCV